MYVCMYVRICVCVCVFVCSCACNPTVHTLTNPGGYVLALRERILSKEYIRSSQPEADDFWFRIHPRRLALQPTTRGLDSTSRG